MFFSGAVIGKGDHKKESNFEKEAKMLDFEACDLITPSCLISVSFH
jgi:hypothetical protein